MAKKNNYKIIIKTEEENFIKVVDTLHNFLNDIKNDIINNKSLTFVVDVWNDEIIIPLYKGSFNWLPLFGELNKLGCYIYIM